MLIVPGLDLCVSEQQMVLITVCLILLVLDFMSISIDLETEDQQKGLVVVRLKHYFRNRN